MLKQINNVKGDLNLDLLDGEQYLTSLLDQFKPLKSHTSACCDVLTVS